MSPFSKDRTPKEVFGEFNMLYLREHCLTEIRLYDERLPLEPDYSVTEPSAGDNFDSQTYVSTDISKSEEVQLLHAPPGYISTS